MQHKQTHRLVVKTKPRKGLKARASAPHLNRKREAKKTGVWR